MTPTRTAIDSLNRDFLDMRSRLLDLAAALDRVDGAQEPHVARGDPRMSKLLEGLRILAEGRPERAERVQKVFSQAYEEGWLSQWRMANSL